MEFFDQYINAFSEVSAVQLAVFIPMFLVVYFLPAMIAIFRNRNQLKLIAIANIPAGFSWIAWFALIGWAVSGKELKKIKLTKKN
ncbi:MAG: superinfection immunity protein [Gammaproteobacteria bacterium]|nr:superinfection immunity protein [Gammaproteobacteria bacterium]